MEPNRVENEKAIEKVFEERWSEKAEAAASSSDQASAASKRRSGFKALPNGSYTGCVMIQIGTVASQSSPNYGLKKYNLELVVTAGEYKGKTAYFSYVIVPYFLATPPPPPSDTQKIAEWRAAVKICRDKADSFLAACGVDTKTRDNTQLMQNIAENNRRRPLVNFTMKDGTPHVNRIVSKQSANPEDTLFAPQTLPDGNDLPLT